MTAPRPFRVITEAPTDTPVEVLHGPRQSVTLAQWDAHQQVWIRVGDPNRRALHRVTSWRQPAQ